MKELWKSFRQDELELQYNARASVKDFDFEIERYRSLSLQSYTQCKVIQDLSYGPTQYERIDYFPSVPKAPVFIFIHGGYWRLLGREDSAFMAKALGKIGISTAVCGPGSIEQAHKIDEFIELNEIKKCLKFLEGVKNKSIN